MLQYAPRLAQFYLLVNEKRTDKLHQSIGGDGAPVCGTSYLLSFLNVCERLASSRERYLTFGTDEDESSPVSRNYVRSVPVPPIQNGVFCHFYLKLCPDWVEILTWCCSFFMKCSNLRNLFLKWEKSSSKLARFQTTWSNYMLFTVVSFMGLLGDSTLQCIWDVCIYNFVQIYPQLRPKEVFVSECSASLLVSWRTVPRLSALLHVCLKSVISQPTKVIITTAILRDPSDQKVSTNGNHGVMRNDASSWGRRMPSKEKMLRMRN